MPRRAFYSTVLVVYVAALALTTLTPTDEPAGAAAGVRWVPLTQTVAMLQSRTWTVTLAQIAGNVALFVPLGWLLPMTWAYLRSPRRIVLVGAACSLLIEVAQVAIPGRTPAVDDILLNTLGALLGAVMFLAPRNA